MKKKYSFFGWFLMIFSSYFLANQFIVLAVYEVPQTDQALIYIAVTLIWLGVLLINWKEK